MISDRENDEMKLHATIADYQTDILIQDDGSRVHAELDGRRYEVDVRESGVSGYALIADGQVFDCRVDGRPDSGEAIGGIVSGSSRAAATKSMSANPAFRVTR